MMALLRLVCKHGHGLLILVTGIFLIVTLCLSELIFIPLFQSSVNKQQRGSKANYSIPTVDAFVEVYQSKQIAFGSKFILRDNEPYTTFLVELLSETIKEPPLHLNLTIDRSQTNTSAQDMRSWENFYAGISQYGLEDSNSPDTVRNLLKDLSTRTIVEADWLPECKQAALIMKLDDGAVGIFKPKRFSINLETSADLLYFSEYERHNAEIAAYHLDRILGFYRAPPTIGRTINVTSVIKRGFTTPYTSPGGNHCVYVPCKQYWSTLWAICGDPHILQGSITISLPGKVLPTVWNQETHPWARTYNMTKAAWELDDGYCEHNVKTDPKFKDGRILLDLTDAAVFDFLTGHMNRHHYGTFQEFEQKAYLLHTDNSYGFCRVKYDCISCLAPLRQCCQIRLSTIAKLIKLYQGPDSLSHLMRESMASDPVSPILSEPHLDALDRRLGKVIKAVSDCINNGRSWDDVVIDDRVHL